MMPRAEHTFAEHLRSVAQDGHHCPTPGCTRIATRSGPLEVMTEFEGARFTVTVRNHGRAVAGRADIPEETPTLDPRGLGLYVMGQVMDEVEVLAHGPGEPGTAVRMVISRLADR